MEASKNTRTDLCIESCIFVHECICAYEFTVYGIQRWMLPRTLAPICVQNHVYLYMNAYVHMNLHVYEIQRWMLPRTLASICVYNHEYLYMNAHVCMNLQVCDIQKRVHPRSLAPICEVHKESDRERGRDRGTERKREGGRERPDIRAVDRSEREIDKRRERVIVRGEGEGGRDGKKETCNQRCRAK